jgi:hypothetical protein
MEVVLYSKFNIREVQHLNKLVLIFDYFKEAFHINKKNKSLYMPQIALIAVKVFITLFIGIGVYNWVNIGEITSLNAMRSDEILSFVLNQGYKLLAIILVYTLLSVGVESGLLNMYKKAVTQGYVEAGDFKEGLSKYFFKLLLGEILIVLCWIPILPFYLILGIVTLTAGLTIIPIVIAVFLTMWKISLVMNDTGIFAAVKDSFSYAKRNFIPLTVLQTIHWAFANGASGGGGGSSNISNITNLNNDFNQGFNESLLPMPGMMEVIRVIKIIIAIFIPIISIMIIVVSIIAMIFEVFFSLTLFVAYKNGFKVEEKLVDPLEMPAVDEALENKDAADTIEANEENHEVEEENSVEEVNTQSDSEEVKIKEVEQ